jgi:hypothetical protein
MRLKKASYKKDNIFEAKKIRRLSGIKNHSRKNILFIFNLYFWQEKTVSPLVGGEALNKLKIGVFGSIIRVKTLKHPTGGNDYGGRCQGHLNDL